MRTVIWFSCGACSAICAWLYRDHPETCFVYCDTGGEHPDNKRFLIDIENLIGHKIVVLKNEKYTDHIDVCEKTKYINGSDGARCTVELKKKMRYRFQLPTDIQILGYAYDEIDRAESFQKSFPEVNAVFPLIERKIAKKDCVSMIGGLGLEMPVMYRLGYNNNNCIGCVKGGKGYWNKIRKNFPDVFGRMAKAERFIGASCIKEELPDKNTRRVYLDELDPEAGRDIREYDMNCDFVCQILINDNAP
jgi:hypothetical protein